MQTMQFPPQLRSPRPTVWLSCRLRLLVAITALAAGSLTTRPASAQPQNFQNPNVGFGQGVGNNAILGSPGATAGPGGAANADFDSLIDLIESTVATESWAETGGGPGDIRPFPTGVLVDAAGVLQMVRVAAPDLAERRAAAPPIESRDSSTTASGSASTADATRDPRRAAKLRYVSLPRLEREIIRRQDAHEPFDASMLTLAGLQRVAYIFVYPETGDLVLAGPAGDWRVDAFGRIVSADTGQGVVRLDDLLVLLRRSQQSAATFFGCAINPRQEALAETQAYLDRTGARPLAPGRRNAWLGKLRDTLGRQEIEIFGIDPASRVARVMVEADVHMKLVGMGLEEGVDGVESYLNSVKNAGGQATAMSVLRWWFALDYAAIRVSPAGDAYELTGQGVRVLSENELLAARGERVHTGRSDPLNQQFAESFTAHFGALAQKYPVYGELRAIFDLALAVALIDADKLAERAGWRPTRLAEAEKLRLPQWPVPRETETVANCVAVNRRQLIAGVSGGVMVAAADVLAKREGASGNSLESQRQTPPPKDEADQTITWWWDAE